MKRYLIAGLLVWVPVGVTAIVLSFLIDLMDRTLLLIPQAYRPDTVLGFHIPGLGILLTFAVLLVTGMIVANLFGRKLVGLGESIVARIPFVRTLYQGVKQIMETVFSTHGQAFRKVVLVEYPRPGLWTIAFHTSSDMGEAQQKIAPDVINVFIPTTPNPTSGFFFMLPRKDAIELDMSVDDGLKMIITAGVVVPKMPPVTATPVERQAANG